MSAQPALNDLSIEERLETLKLLGDALRFSALIARRHGDDACGAMDRLAERMHADADTLALDPSPLTNTLVKEAIALLGDFQMAHPHISDSKH